MKVGFIGLGNMGGPMAGNLLAAGFDLAVFNRTRARADALEARGAQVADSPGALADEVDCVLTCLASVRASRELYLGDGGLLAGSHAGQIFVDHATVDLDTSRACARAARERAVGFLDAPISGGPEGASNATLSIMAGGEVETFERARPVFEAMGKTIRRMGDAGAGTVTKLVNQHLVGVHTAAACEALAVAEKAGVDLGELLAVLRNSWGQSRMLERGTPLIATGKFENTGAPLRNIVKDLRAVGDLVAALELDAPFAARALELYAALQDGGKGEHDMVELFRGFRGKIGAE